MRQNLIEQVECDAWQFTDVINVVSRDLAGGGVASRIDGRAINYVGTARDLYEQIANRKESARSYAIDLIGHCVQGKLHLGDWHVAGGADLARFVPVFKRLRINTIRLLGCETGGEGGLLRRVKDSLKDMHIYGTAEPLDAESFDSAGLRCFGIEPLKKAHSAGTRTVESLLRIARMPTMAITRRDLAAQMRRLRHKVDVHEVPKSVFEGLVARWYQESARVQVVNGLLALPELEVLGTAPAHGPEGMRASIFLGGKIACIGCGEMRAALAAPRGMKWPRNVSELRMHIESL